MYIITLDNIINNTSNFPKGSFAEWFGKDLIGQTYDGDIDCCYSKLTSLYGCPSIVKGDFYCNDNKLRSLEGAPQKVGGNFDCAGNELTSLKGAPQEVGGNFYCDNNQLTSLQGAPQKVGGNFYCGNNPDLKSLDGIGNVKGRISSPWY